MEIVLLRTPDSIGACLKDLDHTHLSSLDSPPENKLVILDNRNCEWDSETIVSLSLNNKVLLLVNNNFEETEKVKSLFFDESLDNSSISLISKIGWTVDLGQDFDENFYQKEYPDLSGYWLPWAKDNGFSERQRLFHHYYLYGKKEGRLCNEEAKIARYKKPEPKPAHAPFNFDFNLEPDASLRILVKVSTLGRPEMLFKCLDSFVQNMSGKNSVFFCITCNLDDETMTDEVVGELKSRYENIKVFFGNHKSKIDAYNADLDNLDFDILVAASDDMVAVKKDYDRVISHCMSQYFPDADGVIWFETCDGNQRTDTLSVMGRRYFERFGCVYKSDYLGYYCDDEFTQVAFKLGRLKRIDCSIICHNIPDHLKMCEDSTYLKSLVYGMRDKALYKIRKEVQFDIPGAAENVDGDFPEVFFEDKRNKREKSYWLTPHPKFDDPISPMEVYVLENMDRKVAEMDTERFLSFAGNYFRDFRWTIPPIVHQIWFGEVPSRIKEMMETFSEDYVNKNPGAKYIFWNEKRLKSLGMMNRDLFDLETKYDGKSDIARLEILNRFGGFYVDSDCVWLGGKSLNSVPSKNGIMIAYEKAGNSIGKGYLEKETTRCANGVFGATVANPIIAFMIGRLKDTYSSRRRHGVVASTGPDFVQGVLDSLPGLTETASHKYFYPVWWCVNKDKNPGYDDFLRQRDLSVESLALLHPESVLFHKGFTSAEGVSP